MSGLPDLTLPENNPLIPTDAADVVQPGGQPGRLSVDDLEQEIRAFIKGGNAQDYERIKALFTI